MGAAEHNSSKIKRLCDIPDFSELLSYQDVLQDMQMRLRLFSSQAALITHNSAWAHYKKAEEKNSLAKGDGGGLK